jgi:predicted nuclease of predicted toxin-antitoxin system
MKLLFDQNISHRILTYLPSSYLNCTHVKKEGLTDHDDHSIWLFAKTHGYTIVSQDSDFNEILALKDFPPKIIWIRTGNISTSMLAKILIDRHSEILDFLQDKDRGLMEILWLHQSN